MKKLNEEQQQVWDKLTYVPIPEITLVNFDVNSMYAMMSDNVFHITKVEPQGDGLVTIKVIKNR